MKMNYKINRVINGKLNPELGLVIEGDLDLRGTDITELPENLTVSGFLDLEGATCITKLPENLTVGGYIDLKNTNITELPENFTVGGYLNLENTKITKLPENLTVGDYLNLRDTDITELPENLTVGGDLILEDTNITNYPVVYNCGSEDLAIYLDLEDKDLIVMGCFKGTKEEAIQEATKECRNKTDRSLYIRKIKECFKLGKKFA
jgi:hypothetical protein